MKVKMALLGMMMMTVTALAACSGVTQEVEDSPAAGDKAEQTDIGVVKQVFVDESQDGQIVEVVAGNLVTVTLGSNPTTGFRWELAEPIDERMLALIESKYVPGDESQQDKPVAGAGGNEEWTFETLAAGDVTISMAYSRPWEGGEKGVETFNLTLRCLSGRTP